MSSLILIIVLLFLSVQFSVLMVKNHTIALVYTFFWWLAKLITSSYSHQQFELHFGELPVWDFFFYPIFYWLFWLIGFKFFKYPECPNIF